MNLFSPDRLRVLIFNVDFASPSYLGFGFYLVISLLTLDRLRNFPFYVKLGSIGYLGFGGH